MGNAAARIIASHRDAEEVDWQGGKTARAVLMRVKNSRFAVAAIFRSGLAVAACIAAFIPAAWAVSEFDDVTVVHRVLNRVLENERTGTVVRWHNPRSGNSGTVKPVRTFTEAGNVPCRVYERTFRKNNLIKVVEGTACRLNSGIWKIRSEKAPVTRAIEARAPATPAREMVPLSNTQSALARAGYYGGKVDGKMGAATRTAILKYQMSSDPVFEGRKLESRLGNILP